MYNVVVQTNYQYFIKTSYKKFTKKSSKAKSHIQFSTILLTGNNIGSVVYQKRNMNSNLVNRIRKSDNRNWSYTMDSKILIQSEQRNRMQKLEYNKLERQFKLERNLTSVAIGQAQKNMQRKMDKLQTRLEECRVRYKQRKDLYDRVLKKRSTRPDHSRSRSENNKIRDVNVQSDKVVGLHVMQRSTTVAAQPHYIVKDDNKTTSLTKEKPVIKRVSFIDRAMTDLCKLEMKHLHMYDRNMNMLKQLERQTGVELHHSQRIKRELFQPPPTPVDSPTPPTDYAIDTVKGTNSTGPITVNPPRAAKVQSFNTTNKNMNPRDVILPFITRLAKFESRDNAKTNYQSLQRKESMKIEKPDQETFSLPMLNIGIQPNKYKQELAAEENPFLANMPLPKIVRKRDLINAAKANQMYIWLGYKNHSEFLKALEESRKTGKPLKNLLEEEHLEVDVLETLSEVSSSEESEEEQYVDERFQVFNNKKIKEKDKKNSKNKKLEVIDGKPTKRLQAAIKAVLAMTYFKMAPPEEKA